MKSKLARQITLEVAAVILGVMLIYAVFQFLVGEAHPVTLLFRHLWHTVVLGTLVYLMLIWRFQALFLRPLRNVFSHGNEMSKGTFRRREYSKTHNELDQLTGMMNLIAAHLQFVQQTPWSEYADSVEKHLELLRARDDLPMGAYADLGGMRDNLRNMEVAIMQFLESATKAQGTEAES